MRFTTYLKLPSRTINILIILTTLLAAVYYFSKHTSLLRSLAHINPLTGLIVLALYLLMLLVLVFVLTATINIANLKLGFLENLLLNGYSIFINFFIPGQAGTAYRTFYLKKKHKLSIVDYTLATILYYLMYGVLSIVLMSIGSQHWWLSLGLFIIVSIIAVIGTRLYVSKFKNSRIRLNLNTLAFLALITITQAIVQVAIYWIELHSVNHHIRFAQAITYTGAADLAIFVSVTPAAIGIRESFLILSEKLHHVTTSNIVLANVIDRSVFIVFLLLVGLMVVVIKAKKHINTLKIS